MSNTTSFQALTPEEAIAGYEGFIARSQARIKALEEQLNNDEITAEECDEKQEYHEGMLAFYRKRIADLRKEMSK